MEKANLGEIAKALADGIRESLCSSKPWFFARLLSLIAGGKPVTVEQIADTLHICRDEVTASLRQMPSVEFDHDGNVIGSGLTLTPTPNHFHVGGHELFAWCALDTLFFPVILKQPVHVESVCPVSGVEVQLTITPERIKDLEPTSAVVSIVIPKAAEACCDVRGAFCNQVHFFSSPEAASGWLTEHQEAIILPVEDAYQLGHILIEHLFKETSKYKRNR